MKNKKNLNKKISSEIGVGVVLLVSVLIGGVFYFKNKKEANEISVFQELQMQKQRTIDVQNNSRQNLAQVQENLIPEEVGKDVENIPISDWKLFTNKKEGYSVRYPSAWSSSFVDGTSFFAKDLRKPGEDYPNFGNILSSHVEQLKNISGDYFINISFYPQVGVHSDLKEWRKYDGANYQEVLIKGYQALKFDEKPHESYDGKGQSIAGTLSYYFIDNKNNGYDITIWYKDASNGVGDRIISTLTLN